jgi:PPP family 3-phenylpropionic acid transporter
VYCSKIGISDTQIGFLLGAGSIISIVSQPLWGMVSDKFRTIRKVLLLILLISVVVGTLMYRTSGLWSISLFVALMYIFYLPTDPLVESLNFQSAVHAGIPYGSVRMFGALGYAVTSLLVGYSVQWWGIGTLSWIYLACGIVALLLCLSLTDVQASVKPALLGNLKEFFMQSHTLVFFLLVFIVAIPHKMNDIFIGLYMDELGGEVRLTGLSWFVMTITETVFFAVSARVIKPGREPLLMTIAAGLYTLRFLLCSLIDNPNALVGLQVFQGFTFVFFYASAIQYLYSMVPEQWRSTGQTVLTVLFFGVSGIIGSSVGGWMMDAFGGAMLYRVMAVAAGFGFVFSFILLRQAKRGAQQTST